MSRSHGRTRRIPAAEPGGEPVCRLTPEAACARRAPIDRLLEDGTFQAAESGYAIHLPAGEAYWRLANLFAEEEAACCPALAVEVEEQERGTMVRAAFV